MNMPFEDIPWLLILTVLFLFVYTILLNLYFVYKNGFSVNVNCWFCNKNFKVPHTERNGFECPFCSQYNGFNEDGSYNKTIEAQHNASLNDQGLFSTKKVAGAIFRWTNGLCDSCNRNQELKVLQLANYEPMVEKCYDKEIEHFEKQLEKTYAPCKTCAKIVQTTIKKQNKSIFGNRIRNLRNTLLFNGGAGATSGSRSKLSITRIFLLIISMFNTCVLCGLEPIIPQINISLPKNVILTPYVELCKDILQLTNKQQSRALPMSMLGFTVQLIFAVFELETGLFGKSNRLLSWLIISLIEIFQFNKSILHYINFLQIFCSLYLVYSYLQSIWKSLFVKKPHNVSLTSFAKFPQSEDELDESDTIIRKKISPSRPKSSPMKHKHATGLNNHFNDLNIGAFNKFQRQVPSPNPFTTQKAQSVNLQYNGQFLNSSARSVSPPMSMRAGPTFMPYQPFNGLNNSSFQRVNSPFSCTSAPNVPTEPTGIFQPLFSNGNLNQNPWSPSRFGSDSRSVNGNFSMPFNKEFPLWSNFGDAALRQRFVVNSLFASNSMAKNVSRSSSSSSGFASSACFGDIAASRSLPNTRDNSPERGFVC